MINGYRLFDEEHFECLLETRKKFEESYFVSYIDSLYNSDVEFQSTVRKFKLRLNKYEYTKDMRFEEECERYVNYYNTKYNDYVERKNMRFALNHDMENVMVFSHTKYNDYT